MRMMEKDDLTTVLFIVGLVMVAACMFLYGETP